MTPQEFQALAAQGYNRIPLIRQADAGLDTPLSAYLKLAAGPYSFLFESVQGGEKWGRYSLLGLPARTRIETRGDTTVVLRDGVATARHQGNPLAFIEQYRQGLRAPVLPGLPRFTGGLVGCFGYDTVRYIEPCLAGRAPPDELGLPDILLLEAEAVLVFDNLAGCLYLVLNVDPAEPDAYARGQARLDALTARLRAGLDYPPAPPAAPIAEGDFVSGFTQARFEEAVRRIQRYIRDGDVMQVVLSQRLSVPLVASSLDVYRALRALNPSPYLFHMDLGGFQVVGSSPEILTRLEDGVVTVRPIAGTRPRGRDEVQDRALERELLADPKERAEHLMLIDLGRNDVGRISQPGSVRVTEQMVIERYSHVMHIVSNVTGRVRPGLTALDALAATFPAGTVSGAPKVRAMEIIDELEPVKRGVYAGAVGYIGYCGNMDTAIAIRTAVIQGGRLYIQAGAGVVADSDPTREWEETLNKGRAMFRAVSRAQSGS